MEVESVLICRACMKADGIFLPLYGDDTEQKNLPDKLAELANIQIAKEDGLPSVLCPKCAYRTSAFYDFKLQVQQSQFKLCKMFAVRPETPSVNLNPSTWEDDDIAPKEEDLLASMATNSPYIGKILSDTNYLSPPEQLPDSPPEDLKFSSETDLETVETFDQLFIENPAEFSIDQKDLIHKEEIPKELQEILESDDVGYTLLYIPPDDVELRLRDGNEEEEELELDVEEPEIDSSSQDIHIEMSLSPVTETLQLESELQQSPEVNSEKNDSDTEDCADPTPNLLGSLNDTLVRIKELKNVSGGITYQCSLCMENYDQLTSILCHTVDNHIPSTGPFFCVVCEKDCDTEKELRDHVQSHTGSNPYTCFICDKAYSTKRYLKRHMVCHTDFRKHRCPKCGLRFQIKSELEIHATTHLHGAPYVCSQCPRIFNHKGNYKRHLISHLDPQGLRLPKYPCHMCGKRFLNNRTLQTHIRVHTGEKPFTCEICNRSFSQQGNLLNHMRIHSNPRSYTCEVCGKRFNQRATLRDHGLLHTGEKPYVCSVCGIAFTFSAALRRHMWVHAGGKPFSCSFCEAKFVGRYDLNRHMKIHNDKPRQKRRTNAVKEQEVVDPLAVDALIDDQISPAVETAFVEQVLLDDEHVTDIAPQGESEKENVDALFNLIQYS